MSVASKIILAAFFLALITVESDGQVSMSQPVKPDQIAGYVNSHSDNANLTAIWKRLGAKIEGAGPGQCGCHSDDCPGKCNAAVFDAGQNGQTSSRRVVRVCYAGGADCRYLVFSRRRGWHFVGTIESLGNQYRPPQHRHVRWRDKTWLVIEGLSGRGTGFLNYIDRWYDIDKQNLPEVLTYPVSGHRVQGDRARDYEFTSNILVNRRYPLSVSIEYRAHELPQSYGGSSIDWGTSQEYRLCYDWDSRKGRFRLNRSRSALPKVTDAMHFLEDRANQQQ